MIQTKIKARLKMTGFYYQLSIVNYPFITGSD